MCIRDRFSVCTHESCLAAVAGGCKMLDSFVPDRTSRVVRSTPACLYTDPVAGAFFCRSLSCMHYAVHPPHARRLAWLAVVCMWLFSYFGHCGEWSRIESVGCSPMLCHCLLHNYSHWTVRRWRLTSSINAGGQQSSSCLSSVSLCRIGKWRHFRRYYPRPINDNKW